MIFHTETGWREGKMVLSTRRGCLDWKSERTKDTHVISGKRTKNRMRPSIYLSVELSIEAKNTELLHAYLGAIMISPSPLTSLATPVFASHHRASTIR